MARLYRRTASLLLIVLLAWGPAAASVCQAWCPDTPAPLAEATATGHHVDPAHRHHGSEAGAEPNDAVASLIHASPDCCATIAQPPRSTKAGRADANVVPSSDVAVLASVAVPAAPHHGLTGRTRGAPPGVVSARTPLVLRV